ncbi:Endosomal targeting bro1-like domain-containing protein [Thalictrum thalictroides]|uniref:Endosomal targeting bro1-like domain-containing protein n=1 Tax=Thalictrum thalictroides TaxID=46969 RepID=A0A7J6WVW5_THATH|nr:Endosomal targeting bro1-like domain-containing protein [Thalictrum thalictroides]
MGCTSSSSSVSKKIYNVGNKKKLSITEVVVFVPAMRIPFDFDIQRPLKGLIPRVIIDKLSAIRSQIVLLVAEYTGGTAYTELNGALEQYLSLALGLTKKEYGAEDKVEFKWKILQETRQEICIASSWFEVLSVLYMMAILALSEANSLLLPKDPMDAIERTVSEECKKDAIDLLIKAAGYLEFCVRGVLIHLPPDIKTKLPNDFQEGVLEAISIQILGQGTEMQLGLAVESQNASLSVKRRLACEQLSYFAQAHYCLSGCNMAHACGKKHLMFIKWKYLEAKAAAYYYHGLILDKGKAPSGHSNAVCCFLAANKLLTDSKKACLSFCLASPVSRVPPIWGVMKHLHEKIPEVASRKCQMYGYLLEQEKSLKSVPDLPEFSLSLRPDDYKLPEIDPAWDTEKLETKVPTLKEQH